MYAWKLFFSVAQFRCLLYRRWKHWNDDGNIEVFFKSIPDTAIIPIKEKPWSIQKSIPHHAKHAGILTVAEFLKQF